jgi:3'-phosphoadenosine 5'-phosphosulfate sulfotransferase (PAPS reductase)/FAD synthetase
MRWCELEREQKRDLDYKIGIAQGVITEALSVTRHRPAVAFSAGKDSTVLLHLVRQVCPDVAVVYGNTGVEYPECVQFARWLRQEWNLNFYEAKLGHTESPGYRYAGQRRIWERLRADGSIGSVLKPDGRLSSMAALERACPPALADELQRERLVWPEGSVKSYWWCADQYGWPLLGKAWSKLKARRINIDTFLAFSSSISTDASLLAYHDILRDVKISQACCAILKKEPSEQLQATLDVDLIFKGLMASESRARAKNFLTRGYLFTGAKRKHLVADPFWHCQPMAIWTDDDVWAYIHRFNLPYAKLYDMGYTDSHGKQHKIKRNGCMGCGTDLLFPNNHMAMLRRTHPRAWLSFMRGGMAQQIQNLQRVRRNGQLSLYDVFTCEELLDRRPCAFDDLDQVAYGGIDEAEEFDPDA